MVKQEFLEMLRQALNGKVALEQLTENMRFYEDYINTEIRKGKSEEEVLDGLGDPRLIARTIVETGGGQSRCSTEYSESGGEWYDSRASQEYGEYGQTEGRPQRMRLRVPVWVWVILALMIIILILSVVFSVLTAILPVVLPILLVLFLVKAFRDWWS